VKKKRKDELDTGLEDGSALSRRSSLTASDVQAQEFRAGLRGYNEKDVDAFLDRITEEFEKLTEENQRLRGGASLDGGNEIADAARAAEEIRTKARQEAAAILAAANAQAGSGAGSAGGAAPGEGAYIGKFISSEKAFLESLADLIRGHAETVKSTVRDAQAAQTREAQSAAAALAEDVRSAPPAAAPTPPEPAADAGSSSAETWPEASTHPAPQAVADVSANAALGNADETNSPAPAMSIPPPATEPIAESAWSATTSPAAPAYVPPSPAPPTPAFEVSAPEPQASSVLQDDVISIPPSEVDTPGRDASASSSFDSDVRSDEPEPAVRVTDDSLQDAGRPEAMAEEAHEEARQRPEEERSLRELFWGEE
jgi:DivIVA domain-containing protein